ncbi:uncharacterized protein ACRADG_010283 [Cochliomyia hominivorax]
MCFTAKSQAIFIGVISVLTWLILAIFSVYEITLIEEKFKETEKILAIITDVSFLVVSLIMIIISVLYVVGIIKKHHKLMIPWLIVSAIIFILNCIFHFYYAVSATIQGNLRATMIIFAILNIWIFGKTLEFIFKLYKDIREGRL